MTQADGADDPDGALYPLSFDPIYQYRLWGGRRLAHWLSAPLPGEGPIGEAWILSDRDDRPSRVSNGPLKGRTLAEVMATSRTGLMGRLAGRFDRFPLLLKFLDVQSMLSVQTHPPDDRADLIPPGETGKTEAWVILEAAPTSRVYAGLSPGVIATDLRTLSRRTADKTLAHFTPEAGQTVLIPAGVVHALGDGVVAFEVQENSDVTFRLYDWDHVDPLTGLPRPLQIEAALACVDFQQGVVRPLAPVIDPARAGLVEHLVSCSHFAVRRLSGVERFIVGGAGGPEILICVQGAGNVEWTGRDFPMVKGAVTLLPAALGTLVFRPNGPATLLAVSIPDTQ